MAWWILFIAGLFEIAWANGLKASHGFTKIGPSIFTVVTLAISMILLGIALRTIPVGTGYAVWTGIGAVGTAIIGMVYFGDPVTLPRIAFLMCIFAGIIGLKFVSH
ncbi:DMT family transporter [Planctomicrobium sp. SH668]|uniref:DMT family transporter n=1 Tax=Planctomicrobium sp. SH668 TaxID=3448126 RepID=UPI003F5BF317